MARRYFSAPRLRILMPGAEAGPGAEVPHPALRADLSRQGEVIRAPILQKSTVSLVVGEGEGEGSGTLQALPN